MLNQAGPDVGLIFQPEWLSILIVSAGLVSVALEAGRPWRARFILSQISSSWMSREALLAAVFMLLCILQWLWPNAALQALCAACAAGFMVAQGFLLYASRGIPAWNSPVLPLFMVVSSFYAGCGLNMVDHLAAGVVSPNVFLAALITGIGHWSIWHTYRRSLGWDQVRVAGRFAARKPESLNETVLMHLLPLGLIGLCVLMANFTVAEFLSSVLTVAAGVGMFLSGSFWKYRILSKMGIQREIGIYC